MLAQVPADLISELTPRIPGGNPLLPEFEPILISTKNAATGVFGCHSLRFFIEEDLVTTVPVPPLNNEPFTLILSGDTQDTCVPRLSAAEGEQGYTIDGNTIVIRTDNIQGSPLAQCHFVGVRAYSVRVDVEPLPTGSYEALYTLDTPFERRELARYAFVVRRAQPAIDALEPGSVAAGTAEAIPLSIVGSGFEEGNTKSPLERSGAIRRRPKVPI